MSSKLIADKSCVSSAKILHWQGLARSASLHLRPQITCKVIGILGKDEQVPILTVAAGGVFAPTSPSSQNARIGTDWGPFFQICCNLPIGKCCGYNRTKQCCAVDLAGFVVLEHALSLG